MIASIIDHTYLKPDATLNDIIKLIDEATKYNFASICIAPIWVPFASGALKHHETNICCVIGFPHGNNSLHAKKEEIKFCSYNKADEFDVVINIGAIKSSKWGEIEIEVAEVRQATKGKILKYIIETGYLTVAETEKVCKILLNNNVDYVKTSTGYGPRGASIEDMILLKGIVGDKMKIKASGGIKTYEFAKQLIDKGADRLGTSSGIEIIKNAI
jgi:deoxyribose-phosphate aldolase